LALDVHELGLAQRLLEGGREPGEARLDQGERERQRDARASHETPDHGTRVTSATSEKPPGPGRSPAASIVPVTLPMQNADPMVTWWAVVEKPPAARVPVSSMVRANLTPKAPGDSPFCPGQKLPVPEAGLLAVSVVSGFRAIANGAAHML